MATSIRRKRSFSGSVSSRTGFLIGVGVAVAPSPRFSVGLTYEHAELGSEHGAGDLGTVDVDRSLDAALTISAPGIDKPLLEDLVQKAHIVCPYSNAIHKTIDVKLTVA